jgi:hypothetical protein
MRINPVLLYPGDISNHILLRSDQGRPPTRQTVHPRDLGPELCKPELLLKKHGCKHFSCSAEATEVSHLKEGIEGGVPKREFSPNLVTGLKLAGRQPKKGWRES